MAAEAQWTILVFLNAKNDLEPFAFPNFEQMAAVGSGAHVNIVVQFGRPKRHHQPVPANNAWSKTLRFHVQKGMKPTESEALEDLGAVDMGDAKTLADFVAWGRARFPSKRAMLVIWNHGQGWRLRQAVKVGGDEETLRRHAAMRSEIPQDVGIEMRGAAQVADDMKLPGGIRYVSNDDDTGNKLYNRAIQDALSALLKGERLDIIAFDACLMAMTETAYALRDVARVMVASEELEPGSGWNYEPWLRQVVESQGGVDAAALGRAMVKAFEDEYGDSDDTTQSAVDLSKAADLGASLSRYADAAIPLLTSQGAAAFKAARMACSNYAPGYGLHSIDLGRYMEQIGAQHPDGALRASAADVSAKLKAAVIANYASARRKGKYGSHGLAIYHPHSGVAYKHDSDREGYDANNRHFPVEFVERERWASFLRRYWQLVP
jgi:hypothetical protein